MKSAIKALSYVECSALKKFAVNECFVEAVSLAKWVIVKEFYLHPYSIALRTLLV